MSHFSGNLNGSTYVLNIIYSYMPNCMEISKHVLISLDISVVVSLGKGYQRSYQLR